MRQPKVLMVHEVSEWMLDLDLSSFDLITFDDGLYSQYYYHKEFLKYNIPMIFFISTNIIGTEHQSMEFPNCVEAHEKFFLTGDTSDYMNWNQIKTLHSTENCKIGGHSHQHIKYNYDKIKELYLEINDDTSRMLSEFLAHDIKIEDFCHPYNIVIPFRKGILNRYGIFNFYGEERIAIETLK